MFLRIVALTLTLTLILGLGPAPAQVRIESVPDQPTFVVTYDQGTDFSGLTWLGGSEFFAVSNRAKALFPLHIDIDPASGRIAGARFGAKLPIATTYDDLEGIAWAPDLDRVYVSSESAHGIVGFDRTGTTSFAVKVPAIFQQARPNKSLEALTYGAKVFWTCNEDTLACDGPLSSRKQGAIVRLQKMDRQFRPLAQYAYRTETSLFRVHGSGTGVPDLCALPNGEVLVLERVLGLGLSAKIFQIDAHQATETSKLPSLVPADIKPVGKTLLFDRYTAATNFEGIALGPELADGWRSLILISDSDGGFEHSLMPLKIRFDVPPPGKKR